MSYLIKENTFALIPIGKKTKVIENKKTNIINNKIQNIISYNCFINGSTYEGRKKGSSYLIGTSYKPPIIISEKPNIILIPTHSERNPNCSWINLSNILHYNQICNNKIVIEFINSKKIIINISYKIFDRQVMRATRLESSLKSRNY